MTDYEIKILRHLNGEDVEGLRWGAAMSVAIEELYAGGYTTSMTNVKISDKGREFLAALEEG